MWILPLILGTAHLLFCPAHCAEVNQPNIVFIIVDDVGYNDVGYHNSQISTPNIDTLCRQGVRLENYYVQPICSPTRSQLMSGRYQIHTGLYGVIWPNLPVGLPLDSPTLADKLNEAGYSTYALGKWHLGYHKRDFLPTRRGFDRFFGFYMGSQDHFSHKKCMAGRCGTDLHDDTPTTFNHVVNASGDYSTHLYTRRAVEWISTHETGKPLFMYLSYQAAHAPLQVPRSYLNQYRTVKNKRRRVFSAMMTALDEGVGQVVAALKQKGLWNNTLLVFTTDNGAHPKLGGSNYPLRGAKGSFLEGGVRGVGFVASPLLKRKGCTTKELIHVSDWFPTLINLANGTMDGTRDIAGVDQWEAISKGGRSCRSMILHGIDPLTMADGPSPVEGSFDPRIQAAIRVGDYKLVTGPRAAELKKTRRKIKTSKRKPAGARGKKKVFRTTRGRGGRRKKIERQGLEGEAKRKADRKSRQEEAKIRRPAFRRGGRGKKKNMSSRMPRSVLYPVVRGTPDTDPSQPSMENKMVELFNIRNDPLEQFDLSLTEPDIVRELLAKLQEYYETSVPPKNPRRKRIRPVDGFWEPWE